jgi:hypothetical protein
MKNIFEDKDQQLTIVYWVALLITAIELAMICFIYA